MRKCLICESNMVPDQRLKGLLRCPNCRFISTDLDLSREELEELYSEKYFKGDVYTDYLADEVQIKSNFNRKLERIKKVTGSKPKTFVLEIGCAYGLFLDVIRKDAVFLKGIDISKDAIESAQIRMGDRADVIQGDYLDFPLEKDKYDLICMWDTIEHLTSPDKYIEKIAKELKKGGYYCVTTGDVGSLNARIRGRKWRQIRPPVHLHYFSKKTLTKLLKKYGLTPVDITYIGSEFTLRNVLYQIIKLRMGKENLYNRIKNMKLMDLNIYINMHDYMFFIAQKK